VRPPTFGACVTRLPAAQYRNGGAAGRGQRGGLFGSHVCGWRLIAGRKTFTFPPDRRSAISHSSDPTDPSDDRLPSSPLRNSRSGAFQPSGTREIARSRRLRPLLRPSSGTKSPQTAQTENSSQLPAFQQVAAEVTKC
jgi:hypothetical protein